MRVVRVVRLRGAEERCERPCSPPISAATDSPCSVSQAAAKSAAVHAVRTAAALAESVTGSAATTPEGGGATRVAVDGAGRATPLKGAAPRRRGDPLEIRGEIEIRGESHSAPAARPGGTPARPAAADDLEAPLVGDVVRARPR